MNVKSPVKPISDFSRLKGNSIVYGKIKKDGTIYFRKKDILDSLENFLFKGSAAKKYDRTIAAVDISLKRIGFSKENIKSALSHICDSTEHKERVSFDDLKRAMKIVEQTQISSVATDVGFVLGSPLHIQSEYKILRASTLDSSQLLNDQENTKWQTFRTIQESVLSNASAVAASKNTPIDIETFTMEISAVASKAVFTLLDLGKWSEVNGQQIEIDANDLNGGVFSELKSIRDVKATCIVDVYPGSLEVSDFNGQYPAFADAHLRAMLNAAKETVSTARDAGREMRIIFATEDLVLFERIKSLQGNR